MRRIFFRGKVTNEYSKNHAELLLGDWVSGGLDVSTPQAIICNGNEQVEVYPHTIGEYTGEEDEKGKKICEHDVVEFSAFDHFSRADLQYRGVVMFRNGAFWVFVAPSFEPDFDLYEIVSNKKSGVTVIGNVHDNPELLPEYVPELLEPESCADCAYFEYEALFRKAYVCEKAHKTIPDEVKERPDWCPLVNQNGGKNHDYLSEN